MYMHPNIHACMMYMYVLCNIYVSSNIFRVERKLGDIERKEKVLQRWTSDSFEYQTTDKMLMLQMKQDTFTKLEHCARERWFMLMVKAKFAGMLNSILVSKYMFKMHTSRWSIHGISDIKINSG